MAETFFPFDAGTGAEVREDQWRLMARHFLDSGVLLSVANRLEVFADNTGMQVKVKSGAAWLVGHYYESDAEKILPVASAHATLARIDRVVARADFVANTITSTVVQGTAAASPLAPPLTSSLAQHEISLALVTVPAAATSLAAAAVVDDRSLVSSLGDRFDPGPVATFPSVYPVGVTIGLVDAADGWPVTGTLTTHKRGPVRTWQELAAADSGLSTVPRFFRQGYFGSAGPNGWGPWQTVRSGADVQVADIVTSETTTSATYAGLTTTGPAGTVTVGPSGKLRVSISADMANNTAGQSCYASAALTGATASVASDARAVRFASSTAGAGAQMSREIVFTGLAAGSTTITMQYRVTGGTGTFQFRRMNIEAL